MTTREITNNIKPKKYSAFTHNFIINLKANKKNIILITALHLLAIPLLLILAAVSIVTGRGQEVDSWYYIIASGATIVAGLLGVGIAIGNFSYLYKKSQVDMCLSLPVSRRQKFLSDYLSGLAAYIVPFLAVQVISVILLGVFHLAIDGNTYSNLRYWDPTSNIDNTYVCSMFGEIAPYYFKLLIGGILIMAMFYTLTVLVMTCCGSLFESVFYTVIINVMIPLTPYIITYALLNDLYGISAMHKASGIIFSTSPIGGVIGIIVKLSLEQGIAGLILQLLLVTAVFIAAAYFLYMKRRAEQVSKPFVFKGLYYIAVSAIIFCIGTVSTFESEALMPVIIITAVLYLILEIVSNRGFKGIWKGAVRYAVTFGLFFAFAFTVTETDGFGAVSKIPSADSISKIAVKYENALATKNWYSYNNSIEFNPRKLNAEEFIITEEKDSIEALVNLHNQIISDHEAHGGYSVYSDNNKADYTTNYCGINIVYYLKNGSTITRWYSEISSEAFEKLSYFELSNGFKRNVEKNLKSLILDYYDQNSLYSKSNKDYRLFISIGGKFDLNSFQYPYFNFSRQFYEGFADAIIRDINSETAEQRFSGSSEYGIIYDLYNLSIPLKEYYTNTREYLKKNGISFPSTKYSTELERLLLDHNIQILSYDDYVYNTANDKIYSDSPTRPRFYNSNYYNNNRYVYEYSEDLMTLLEVARIQNNTDEKCYTILVNGWLGVIPVEYSDVAERVYNSSREYDPYAYEKGFADDKVYTEQYYG